MTVPATAQFVYQAHDLDKPEVVARILQAENRNRVMIFCRTKRSAQRVADDLAERGFAATPIHGDLNQVAREKALKRFRERQDRRARGHRRRRPRDRRRGRHPRDQLRVPRRREDLRAPDRPDRPGRRLRHRHHLRRLGGPDPLEGDQQHPRAAVRGAARRPTPPPRTSSTTWASTRAPRAGSCRRRRTNRVRTGRGDRDKDRGKDRERDRDRPRRDRSRKRLRNGVAVEREATDPTAESAPGALLESTAATSGTESIEHTEATPGTDSPTKRRRRRRGGRRPGDSGDAPPNEG